MTTSVVNLVQSNHVENSDELISTLESLQSYENLQENTDESAIFEDDTEPSSGLINLIRRNSVVKSTVPNDSSNTVRIIQNKKHSFFFEIIL